MFPAARSLAATWFLLALVYSTTCGECQLVYVHLMQENGRDLRPEIVSSALREAHIIREHLKHDTSDDVSLRRLGEFFEQPDTAGAIAKMVFRALSRPARTWC